MTARKNIAGSPKHTSDSVKIEALTHGALEQGLLPDRCHRWTESPVINT